MKKAIAILLLTLVCALLFSACASPGVDSGRGKGPSWVRIDKILVFSASDLKAAQGLLAKGDTGKRHLPSGATGTCADGKCRFGFGARTVPIESERGPIGEIKMTDLSSEITKGDIENLLELIEKAKAKKGIVTDDGKVLACYAGACSLNLRFDNMAEASTDSAREIKSEEIKGAIQGAKRNASK